MSSAEDTLPSNDTFKQLEILCDESFRRPKIFLNDLPMDNSIFGVESDPTRKQHNVSFLSTFDINPTLTSMQLYKSFSKQDTGYHSHATAADADTRPSAYFSDTSFFMCESHADGYESAKFDSVLESSQNSSGYHGSQYKLRDTLDECNFRRKSQQFDLKEPSTPIKRTFSGQRLDLCANDSIDLSASSGRFSYSNKSGGTAAADFDEMQTMAELEASMYNINMTTSSPIPNAVNGGADFRENDDDGEPVDLDNTLERVNYILAKGGFKTPSPTRMVRRKCIMKKYVSNLLQRDSFYKQVTNTATKPKKFFATPKLRKTIKRTISVDDTLKMLHANTWKA